MRFLTTTVAALACLLLNACFDIREEVWIERDGSGRAKLDYVVPSSAIALAGGEDGLRADVQRLIDSEPALQLDELGITNSGKDSTITLSVSTDSMLSLLDMQENEAFQSLPDTATGFVGTFDVALAGLTVDFKRRLDLQKTLGLASLAISSSERKRRKFRYIIHLPNQALSHNATETADAGRTLIWEYTLGDALSSPIITTFAVRIPIPWWAIGGVIILLSLLTWAIIRTWRRRRSRRPTA